MSNNEIVDETLAGIFTAKQEPTRAPVLIDQLPESNQEKSKDQEQAETDLSYVRGNLYDLIENGTSAVEEMMQVAKESQHPRTYEVLATLIRTMGDMGDKLIQIHKSKQELTGTKSEKKEPSSGINVEKAVFVGSTADLLKKIKQQENGD